MPDQSSASTEHALMQEITAPLATLPDDPVPIAASVEFPTALRGYDRIAVDAYVQKTSQLVAEMQATRSPESAVRRALARVGEEVSGILQRAHETAAQITAQSRSEAEDRLEAARQEAAQLIAGAEARVRELDAETDRIWAERHRIVEDTQGLARELLALTETADERFPADESAGADLGAEVATGEGDVGASGQGDVGASGQSDLGAEVAPGEGEADVAAPELFSTRDAGDEDTGDDRDESTHADRVQAASPDRVQATDPDRVQATDPDRVQAASPDREEAGRHDQDPDIESTAVLPPVEPPRGEDKRA